MSLFSTEFLNQVINETENRIKQLIRQSFSSSWDKPDNGNIADLILLREVTQKLLQVRKYLKDKNIEDSILNEALEKMGNIWQQDKN